MSDNLHKHTVTSFDKELKDISSRLVKMSKYSVDIMNIFLKNLSDPSDKHIEKVKEIDKNVNTLDKEIEKLSTSIIALRHPMAIDLRYVISATKIATIIERQGDIIKSAVKKLTTIDKNIFEPYKKDLAKVCKLVIEMTENSVLGFSNQDTEDANKVWRTEDKVDTLCDDMIGRVKEDIKRDPEEIDNYVSMILIIRNLERCGDYCTKITKAVHYVASGKRVSEGDF